MNSKFSSILIGFTISSLVCGVRSLGILTNWELSLYDQFLQWQPAEPPDPRILVVGIEEQDITTHGKSDLVISKLINKLDQYQPRLIGLDIYRDIPQEPGNIELTADLQANQKIIAICGNSDPSGIAPPPNVPPERTGFADFAIDGQQTVRRNLLSFTPNVDSKCRTGQSFGLLLAFNYLSEEGIKIPDKSKDSNILQIESTIFKPIESNFGGYQNLGKDANGYQILLKYRFPQVAEQVTMSQVLNGEIKPSQIKDRIVLIGYTAVSSKDFFYTPYSNTPTETMPGVVIHAQMISQILSSVLDGRPQIWVWNLWGEFLWIFGWTTFGSWLFIFSQHSLRLLILLESSTIASLAIISCILFTYFSGWVSFLPSFFSLMIGVIILSGYRYIQSNSEKLIDAQLSQLNSDLVDENLIGNRYKIDTDRNGGRLILGEGGSKVVYKAVDLQLPRKKSCVVKKLIIDDILSGISRFELVKTFKQEAELLQELEHPRIPRLLAFYDENQQLYLVEEFIAGKTLHEIIHDGRLSEKKVVTLLMDILEVIQYIHDEGIIHADIKPSNLMVRAEDDKIFLIDFGAFQITKSLYNLTISPRQRFYTPNYASPEQKKEDGEICENSDLYSLGIVAIEALTGNEVKRDGDRIIWRNVVDVRDDLVLILDKMVQPLPGDRYQSAKEVMDALNKIETLGQ